VFAASSLGGAAREKYAAMETGGGAVAAPPKKGQLKDRPAAGRRGRKSVRAFRARFSFFLYFLLFFVHIKRVFSPKKGARAPDGRRGHMLTYTARAVEGGRVPARKASQGKRDKNS